MAHPVDTVDQGYSNSFSKGPDTRDENSLGPVRNLERVYFPESIEDQKKKESSPQLNRVWSMDSMDSIEDQKKKKNNWTGFSTRTR